MNDSQNNHTNAGQCKILEAIQRMERFIHRKQRCRNFKTLSVKQASSVRIKGHKKLNLLKMKCMAISATDKELLKYFSRLDEPQKRSLLELIKTFLGSGKEQSERASLEQYNREIDEAMQRVERGEYTTLEDLEREMQSW